jgi:hypothetical protein
VAKVEQVSKLEAFCSTYDRIYLSNYPSLPVKVRRGSFVKGDLLVFDESVPRHAYKGHYFYGRVYTCYELALDKPVLGQEVIISSESDDWGLL